MKIKCWFCEHEIDTKKVRFLKEFERDKIPQGCGRCGRHYDKAKDFSNNHGTEFTFEDIG